MPRDMKKFYFTVGQRELIIDAIYALLAQNAKVKDGLRKEEIEQDDHSGQILIRYLQISDNERL